jgi:hypothetical protein
MSEIFTITVSDGGNYAPGMLITLSGLSGKLCGKYQVLTVANGMITLRRASFWTRMMYHARYGYPWRYLGWRLRRAAWNAVEKFTRLIGKRAN